MNKVNVKTVDSPRPGARTKASNMEDALAQLWKRPGFLLRRCLQLTSGVFEQSCAELGLTARQYDYLFVLAKVGTIGQGEIGSALGLDRATNTLVIKILERKKWIEREVVESDTRRRMVRITSEGRAAFAATRRAAKTAISSISDALSPQEYDTLVVLLQKVVAANTQAVEAQAEAAAGQ